MDRGAWWATVHGVAKSQTRLSMHASEKRSPHEKEMQACSHLLQNPKCDPNISISTGITWQLVTDAEPQILPQTY